MTDLTNAYNHCLPQWSVEIPWHQPQWQQILPYLQQQRLPHALLLQGPVGIGKAYFAERLAWRLLCHKPVDQLACGHCKSCKLLQAGTHPDLTHLQPEEKMYAIKIKQVREVKQNLQLTALQGGARVVIINPVMQMNINAANALLKHLEEPGNNTFFLLVHRWSAPLLATISSRCQKLTFTMPAVSEARPWLQQHGIAEEQLDLLLQLSSGAPLLALDMMKQDAITMRHKLLVDLTAIFRRQKTPTQVADDWKKLPLERILVWWHHWLIDLVKLKMTDSTINICNQDIIKLLKHVSAKTSIMAVYAMLDALQQHLQSLKQNPNAQLLCEDLLFRWHALTA
jgi:DNA polymerase-3 subunit delta'